MRRKWMLTVVITLATLANGASATQQAQQEKAPKPAGETVIEKEKDMIVLSGQGPEIALAHPQEGDTFLFIASEMGMDEKLVKGAPYSAQAITESIQVLSDGNRIVRKTTASVHRDGEGRVRREQTLRTIGPYAAAGDPPQTIFISDPVAGVSYILDARGRTARKVPVPTLSRRPAEAASSEPRVRHGRSFGSVVIAEGSGSSSHQVYHYSHTDADKNAKTESLGKQTIEGVEAEGTRTTVTIPAGEIGNELPINIVSERWYSPELQTVVLSKHSDPRFGENTYRLTNINRAEPARSLFEVPADYTIEEGPRRGVRMRPERESHRMRLNREKQL